MKRASITVTDDLEPALSAYMRDQEIKPSLTRLLQMALREFLTTRGYLRPPVRRASRSAAPPQPPDRRETTPARPRPPARPASPALRPSEDTDATLL